MASQSPTTPQPSEFARVSPGSSPFQQTSSTQIQLPVKSSFSSMVVHQQQQQQQQQEQQYQQHQERQQQPQQKQQKSQENKNEDTSAQRDEQVNPNNQNQRRMPVKGIAFHRAIDELLNKPIELLNDNDSEVILRLIELEKKSKKELLALEKAFSSLKFFRESKEKLHTKEFEGLLSEIRVEQFQRFENIFSINEIGQKFYIILKGKVCVQLPNSTYGKHEDNSSNNNHSSPFDKKNSTTQLNRPAFKVPSLTMTRQSNYRSSFLLQSMNRNNSSQDSDSDSGSSCLDSPSNSRTNLGFQTKFSQSPMKKQILALALSQELNDSRRGSQTPSSHRKTYLLQQDSNPSLLHRKGIFSEENIKEGNHRPSTGNFLSKNSPTKQQQNRSQLSESPTNLPRISNIGRLSRKSRILSDESNIDSENSLELIKRMYPHFDIARELGAGDSFGEIALVNNSRRTASIICTEETYCAVLSKQSYDKILSQYHQAEQNQNISFLKEFSIFQELTNSKLDSIFLLMEKLQFNKHQTIYTEGEEAKYLYFIREGEIEVSQLTLPLNEEYSPDLSKNPNPLIKQSQSKEHPRRIKIAIIGKNTYFGQEEIIYNSKRLYQTEVYSHSAILYALPKQKFLGIGRFKNSLEILEKEFSERAIWRINQLEKNISTNQKIETEAIRLNHSIDRVQKAKQFIEEKPQLLISTYMSNNLDRVRKAYHEQESAKSGVIRPSKDVKQLNKEYLSQLQEGLKNEKTKKSTEGVNPPPPPSSSSHKKESKFKISLENNLFQEYTDKISERMKKKIMSPAEFKSYLQNKKQQQQQQHHQQQQSQQLQQSQSHQSSPLNSNDPMTPNRVRVSTAENLLKEVLSMRQLSYHEESCSMKILRLSSEHVPSSSVNSQRSHSKSNEQSQSQQQNQQQQQQQQTQQLLQQSSSSSSAIMPTSPSHQLIFQGLPTPKDSIQPYLYSSMLSSFPKQQLHNPASFSNTPKNNNNSNFKGPNTPKSDQISSSVIPTNNINKILDINKRTSIRLLEKEFFTEDLKLPKPQALNLLVQQKHKKTSSDGQFVQKGEITLENKPKFKIPLLSMIPTSPQAQSRQLISSFTSTCQPSTSNPITSESRQGLSRGNSPSSIIDLAKDLAPATGAISGNSTSLNSQSSRILDSIFMTGSVKNKMRVDSLPTKALNHSASHLSPIIRTSISSFANLANAFNNEASAQGSSLQVGSSADRFNEEHIFIPSHRMNKQRKLSSGNNNWPIKPSSSTTHNIHMDKLQNLRKRDKISNSMQFFSDNKEITNQPYFQKYPPMNSKSQLLSSKSTHKLRSLDSQQTITNIQQAPSQFQL